MPATTSAVPHARAYGAMPPAPDPVVLESVSKRYGRRRQAVDALREVSASFTRGTLTAVMGVTGSGKSTLLQCAAGLDAPTCGTVRLAGTDLRTLRRRKLSVLRRRRVGFVFQSLNLVPTLSVAENIALPLRLDGRHVDGDQVRQLAGRVGIAAQLGRLPHTLSGGQQQRTAKQIVVGAGLARSAGLRVGSEVRLPAPSRPGCRPGSPACR